MDNFIRKTDLATVEAQRCCASSQYHRIKWRKTHNNIIRYCFDCHSISQCRFEAQHATPLQSQGKLH